IGFQLSFTAVFIILLTMPVVNRMLPAWIRFRWYGAPLMIVIVSILVQFGLYPILGYYFAEFSLIGPLANALVVPVLGVTVPYALALLPVSSFFPVAGLYLNMPNEYFLRFLNRLTSFGADLPWSWIPVSVDSLLIFVIWTAGILFIASLATPALRFRLLIVFLSLLTLHQASALVKKFSVKRLSVTYFDVGQGDAALVQSPAGRNYLIDTGRWSPGYNSARYVILPHLKAEGIDRLDGIFLSHPHSDHIGGTVEILEEIAVDTLYETGFSYDSDLYKQYRKTAQNKGVPVRQLQAGANLNMDPAMLILVYGPQPGPFGDDPNEHSLVLEFIYGNTEFLFTGDAGTEQERNLLQNYKPLLDSDVLKVGHHGSKTSSSDPFLDKVRPDHAVTSLELQNRFRHPHPDASLRLHNSGAHLHFTSLDRAIIFHSDGNRIWPDEW
ncbi:MAG: ComEC/Rec2 family competence protein, partial [Balneolaceae bacterium]